jgi:predicted metal-dependent HD superfamily phosphohydrolase
VFSIVYHDVIYKALRKDNELKSAEFMKNDLEQFGVPSETIDRCFRQIIQTQKHQLTGESELDDALFLDMDLEVLSWDWNDYLKYTEQIRREYWMYPKAMYYKGRKRAMESFLDRPSIYFTELFRSEFEAKARENVEREVEMLDV